MERDHSIGLGHRRLSIIDLYPAGHQPMHSSSDRYVIAFNGGIYNHLDLRNKLAVCGWQERVGSRQFAVNCVEEAFGYGDAVDMF